jgi:hypothetical protein
VTLRDDVLITTAAMAESIAAGEHAVVENLIARGYSSLRAEILLLFVPLGLGRAIISRLSVDAPMVLPDTAIIQEVDKGSKLGGALFSPSILLRLADAPGFEEWYESLGNDS